MKYGAKRMESGLPVLLIVNTKANAVLFHVI